MAGNGFLLAQAFTNSDLAKAAIETMNRVWLALDGGDGGAAGLARGTLTTVSLFILPAVGLWFAFDALRIADTNSPGLSKSCERRIVWGLIPFAYVVIMGALIFFVRFGWPAVESMR